MTRTLILMRHAKSGWDDALLSDHDRPLNDRGRRSATAMGRWLTAHGYLPGEVLCSSAMRTRETWANLTLSCDAVQYDDALYLAGPDAMLHKLQSATHNTVLMLAHNPGSASLAHLLAQKPADHPRFADYPTCATTVIDFDIQGWSEARFGQGKVRDFAIPREVIAAQS